MQGLADGYFVLPYTIGQYLANVGIDDRPNDDDPAFPLFSKKSNPH